MTAQKKCLGCGKIFIPNHGNNNYHEPSCEREARRKRQKAKRDPISRFIRILVSNHEIISRLYREGKTDLKRDEAEAYQIDFSLFRNLIPPPQHQGKIMMDVGDYYIISEPNFLNLKIFKHDTAEAI